MHTTFILDQTDYDRNLVRIWVIQLDNVDLCPKKMPDSNLMNASYEELLFFKNLRR
jgi:hypothetical protein